MGKILDNLNPQQLEAVKHYEGPMLVMAGAGSGKTKVLTHRIAYLIDEKQINPYNILAITFTNKASKEMKQRVMNLIGEEVGKKMYISTFHALCVHILRQDIDIIGYRSNFVIYDENDSLQAIKRIMADLNLDSKHYPPKRALHAISNLKNDNIFPDQFKKRIGDEFDDMLSQVYKKYQEDLMKANALDFDDLIMLTIRLFERDEDTLKYYQKKFQFILVDEYQDTNKTQFQLVSMLAKKHHNIFVVGDSDQSIYSWRGADIRNIRDFSKDFGTDEKKVKTIYLEQNYRSFQNILDVANCIIQKNYEANTYVKKLWSERKNDHKQVTYYRAVNSDIEVEYIAQKINEKCDNNHVQYNDIAILYRTNAMSLSLEKALMKYKIDYEIVGNVSFFDRKEIKDLVAYLRLVINNSDDVAYLRVVNEPRRGIGDSSLEVLKRYAFESNLSLFEASKLINGLTLRAKNNFMQFAEIIESLQRQLIDLDINDFIDIVLDESGYLLNLKEEKSEEANARIENLNEFKTLTLDLEEDLTEDEVLSNKTLTAFDKLCLVLNNITLSSERKTHKENAVKLMTIHAAKGLEFPVVFIYGVEESIFPLGGDDKTNEEIQEERRLMYVAVTRAKNELYISNSEMRKLYGSYRVNFESRFIGEIDQDLLSFQGVRKAKNIEKRVVNYNAPVNNLSKIKTGSKIIHERFGEGIVVKLDGDIGTIAFSAAHGIKKLDVNHPAITIIK